MIFKHKHDARDFAFHQHYGTVGEFPDEFIVKDAVPDIVQAPGNTQCTCITCCDIASDSNDLEYDVDDLYNRVPHDRNGAIPRDALNETIKRGLLPKNSTSSIRRRDFRSYFTAHTGPLSSFDNVRSALLLAKYPVAVWGPWYTSWNFSTVLTRDTNILCYHMFTVEGWTPKYGVPMLQIEAWCGRKLYMSEAVFNEWIAKWTSGSAVLATDEVAEKRNKTYLESIVDGMKNLIVSFQAYLLEKKTTKV